MFLSIPPLPYVLSFHADTCRSLTVFRLSLPASISMRSTEECLLGGALLLMTCRENAQIAADESTSL